MDTRKHILALGLSLAIGAGGAGLALAQGGTMAGQSGYGPDTGPGMMSGQCGYGMGMGPGMMGGQGGYSMGMGMGHGMMGGGMMHQMLDAEQRSEMRELMKGHRQGQFKRMEQAMDLRYDLMAEMQQTRPDPEVVKEHHARLAELHGEMMAERVRMRNAMHDLLTEEQRKQLR